MRHTAVALAALSTLALASAGCSRKPEPPGRDVVTPLLMQEAQVIKSSGEKPDPGQLITATWELVGTDVKERPNDAATPWAGTVTFRVRTEVKDYGGRVRVEETERRFEYLYNAGLGRWIYQIQP